MSDELDLAFPLVSEAESHLFVRSAGTRALNWFSCLCLLFLTRAHPWYLSFYLQPAIGLRLSGYGADAFIHGGHLLQVSSI